jgi:hypothetical protein
MASNFTVRDLLRAGGPLEGAETLAAEVGLDNPVVWAVSLRPYAPVIPPVKGGEIALAGMDMLGRQGISAANVIERLAQLGAAGFIVRGDVEDQAVETARRVALPLIRVGPDQALPDIEQEIIRECALFQARREIATPQEPWAWIESLVGEQGSGLGDVQAQARRDGYTLPGRLSVAYMVPYDKPKSADETAWLLSILTRQSGKQEQRLAAREYGDGVLVLLPAGSDEASVKRSGWACGIGTERPTGQAGQSLEEAKTAALVSVKIREGATVRYDDMGADRLLALLYKESRAELKAFVRQTLGPLLDHDVRYATQLMPTVEAFAAHAGRLRETAGEIFVHRNTLAYRLERAGEILGKDLKDADTLLNIALALRALRLMGE